MCNTVTRLHVQYGNMSSCAILFALIQPVTQSTAHLTDLQPGSSTDPFTTLPWQAEALHRHIQYLPEQLQIDLVVSSPLTRTLETATGVFAGQAWSDDSQGIPLMREQSGHEVRHLESPSLILHEIGCGTLGGCYARPCIPCGWTAS